MKSRLNLKPGQKGTKKLVEQYGKALLYVRYRYDESRGVRLKTVEIVVEEKPWQPTVRIRDDDIVAVIVNFSEKAMQNRLKSVGGKWDPEVKLWFVPYGPIRGTELEERIHKDYFKRGQEL
ncbi:hypothetical protein [Geobacter sp.]|uniref:hypothetical protein n=1 Tax=Geobacter sp. TaxID=46610 RepID=UPI0027B89569|nr:hypothetical protein [Geobacter sp.]